MPASTPPAVAATPGHAPPLAALPAGERAWHGRALTCGIVLVALALFPLAAGSFGIDLVTKIMIYAIFALSLELLVGQTGLVCFGQAAFFGR